MKKLSLITLGILLVLCTISCFKSPIGECGQFLPGKVLISEVKFRSKLTLRNETNSNVNLGNWKLMEVRQPIFGGRDTSTYFIPAGTMVNQCAEIVFPISTLGFSLSADETVYLYNSQGELISQRFWMFFIN